LLALTDRVQRDNIIAVYMYKEIIRRSSGIRVIVGMVMVMRVVSVVVVVCHVGW
jgi:hypothetical protein